MVKTLGLLGGLGWESTAPYYHLINEGVQKRLGGLHCARMVIVNLDFADIAECQQRGDWAEVGQVLAETARTLHKAGAQGLVLCSNTMHKVSPTIAQAVPIPLLHVADVTGQRLSQAGLHKVGLLGTRFTMEHDFYSQRLRSRHGVQAVVPPSPVRQEMHRIIYDELCCGQFLPASRQFYRRAMADLQAQGVQAIVLACTELALLIDPHDTPLPMFESTALHAQAAIDWMLGDGPH